MDSSDVHITDKQWEKLLSTLSPTKIASLEKTLKTFQNKYQPNEMDNSNINDKENDEFDDLNVVIKVEPLAVNKSFLNSQKNKNRGLTYENGRRNLKTEHVPIEEKERRAKRRERNRVAAQKCRERRQQQIEELEEQVEMLRSAEQQLYSALKELSEEENELRLKLSSHNCVISENNNGDISFTIKNTPNNAPSLRSRPLTASTLASSCSIERPNSLSVSQQKHRNTVDQFISKEESLTPLLSPDSYSILRTENAQKVDVDSTDRKPSFTWSNSIIDQLSSPCVTDPASTMSYLTTPVVDLAPFYSMDWRSSSLI